MALIGIIPIARSSISGDSPTFHIFTILIERNIMLNYTSSKDSLQFSEDLLNATGPIPYGLTNDYMFRVVLQSNEIALKDL